MLTARASVGRRAVLQSVVMRLAVGAGTLIDLESMLARVPALRASDYCIASQNERKRQKEKGERKKAESEISALQKEELPRTCGARRAPFDEFCFALRAQDL